MYFIVHTTIQSSVNVGPVGSNQVRVSDKDVGIRRKRLGRINTKVLTKGEDSIGANLYIGNDNNISDIGNKYYRSRMNIILYDVM